MLTRLRGGQRDAAKQIVDSDWALPTSSSLSTRSVPIRARHRTDSAARPANTVGKPMQQLASRLFHPRLIKAKSLESNPQFTVVRSQAVLPRSNWMIDAELNQNCRIWGRQLRDLSGISQITTLLNVPSCYRKPVSGNCNLLRLRRVHSHMRMAYFTPRSSNAS
jgi:hypothetical protein